MIDCEHYFESNEESEYCAKCCGERLSHVTNESLRKEIESLKLTLLNQNVKSDVVFTAAGGSIGPFRYAVVYNDTPTSPADPLIAWFDYGSSITLLTGETFTADFDASAGLLTIV